MAHLIWTKHALKRLDERKISQTLATQAFRFPDKRRPGKQPGSTEFVSHFDGTWITVVATQNERGEWIAISCWADPPFAGTKDERKKARYRVYQQSGWLKKLWLQALRQLGVWDF